MTHSHDGDHDHPHPHVFGSNTVRGLTPVLNVSSLEDSFDWFQRWGWAKIWDYEDIPGVKTFGAVGNGTVEIFLCRDCQGGRGDSGSWLSVWVDNVDDIFAQCQRESVEVTQPPTDEPWGVREMHVRHPDGHTFRVGRGG